MIFVFLVLVEFASCLPSVAYIDTTPENFVKPKSIEIKPYQYQETQYDKYMETATEKIAPKVLGGLITGPTGLIINLGDKAIKLEEENAKNKHD